MNKKINEEYKTVNLKLFPIESEVSQFKIDEKCNELARKGWTLISQSIIDSTNVMLTFKRAY